MSEDSHAVLFGEFYGLVCVIPEVGVLLGMNHFALHAVFGYDGVVVILHKFLFLRTSSPYEIGVHCCADIKVLAQYIFHCFRVLACSRQ